MNVIFKSFAPIGQLMVVLGLVTLLENQGDLWEQ